MSIRRGFIRTVLQLMDRTRSGSISWELVTPPRAITQRGGDIAICFQTTLHRFVFVIYEHGWSYHTSFELPYWPPRIELSVLSPNGKLLYTAPPHPAIHDLFDLVQERTLDIERYLDSLPDDTDQGPGL